MGSGLSTSAASRKWSTLRRRKTEREVPPNAESSRVLFLLYLIYRTWNVVVEHVDSKSGRGRGSRTVPSEGVHEAARYDSVSLGDDSDLGSCYSFCSCSYCRLRECAQDCIRSSSKKKECQYLEFAKKRTTTNLWTYFLRASDGQSAKCKICLKILKTVGGSTTGLHTHMRTIHAINVDLKKTKDHNSASGYSASTLTDVTPGTSKQSQQTLTSGTKKRKMMTDFFSSKSNDKMEVIVSRMVALDGCSFRFFCESQDLQKIFKKSGYDLPKSPKTISKMIFAQAEKVKADMVMKIQKLKTEGHRFALTLDEWTSLRNKRYMNINLHCVGFGGFNFKNLGLVKITESMSAFAAYNMLRDHLDKFCVSLDDDVVSLTTYGSSVIVKMGTYFKGYHQLCLAHGIQLAVIDTLYKDTKEPQPEVSASIKDEIDSDEDSKSESDEEADCASQRSDDRLEIEPCTAQAEPKTYKELIEKVRSFVRSIKKSPLKADILRQYVKTEHGEDIQLQPDCRTRWSSMSDMIGVFLKIKDSILKLLIDWKCEVSFSDDDIQILNDIHHSLNVIKLAVLALCRRDATLYTADTALRFMLKKLDEQNSFLSVKLATSLRNRIKQRRQPLAGVLHYLQNSEDFFNQADDDDDTFIKPKSDEISKIIVTLLQQLKYSPSSSEGEKNQNNSSNVDVADVAVDDFTLQEQLDRELRKCLQKPRKHSTVNFDLSGFVKFEKAMYDNGGERGVYLTQAYNYLCIVLPTSVESERVFSSAGYFCNRIRSSHSDKMLDSLILLRTHYQEQRCT